MEVDLDDMSSGGPSGGEGGEGHSRSNEADRLARERTRTAPPPVIRPDAPPVPASPPSAAPPAEIPPAAAPAQPEAKPATGTRTPPRLVSEAPVATPPIPATPPNDPAKTDTPEDPDAAAAAATGDDIEEAVEIDEADVEKLVDQFKADDGDCLSWQTEFKANAEELGKICTFDAKGRPVSGELVELAKEMQAINIQLDPKKFKLHNVEEPDEVTKAEYQSRIEALANKHERLLSRYERLDGKNRKLADDYDSRVERARAQARQNLAAGNEAKNADAEVQKHKERGAKEWAESLKAHTDGLTKDEADELQLTLLEKAHAYEVQNGHVPRNFAAFMKAVAPGVRATITAKRGREVAAHLDRKAAQTRQPAPAAAAAAVAAPAAPEGRSSRDSRRAADQRIAELSRRVKVVS